MKTITKEELAVILDKHKKLINSMEGGEIANLSEADLRGANLSGADLSDADLYEADLRGADLRGANLYGADLSEADLRGANLRGADLSEADLRGANLRKDDLRGANLSGADLSDADLYEADLRGADLRGANLYGAKNLNVPFMCPEEGSFIGFKKVTGNLIVKLEIPIDAIRCSATSRKCRCNKAKVLSITNIDGSNAGTVGYSKHDPSFVYNVGEIVSVDNFDTNRWNECSTGIHFFITRQEAVDYLI